MAITWQFINVTNYHVVYLNLHNVISQIYFKEKKPQPETNKIYIFEKHITLITFIDLFQRGS